MTYSNTYKTTFLRKKADNHYLFLHVKYNYDIQNVTILRLLRIKL